MLPALSSHVALLVDVDVTSLVLGRHQVCDSDAAARASLIASIAGLPMDAEMAPNTETTMTKTKAPGHLVVELNVMRMMQTASMRLTIVTDESTRSHKLHALLVGIWALQGQQQYVQIQPPYWPHHEGAYYGQQNDSSPFDRRSGRTLR